MKWLALAVLLVAAPAAADPVPVPVSVPNPNPNSAVPDTVPDTVDAHLAKVRTLYDQGDFARARDELLAAYQLEPRPELLFALGQVELNLGHFQAAIERYEQFIATAPAPDQIALAQQAIGAARARLTEKPAPPPPPRPPPHRDWDRTNTTIAALGGASILTGAGLAAYGHWRGTDHTGTLSTYNRRVDRANLVQWIGAGAAAAGALAVGAAVLRWRIRLVETPLQPIASPDTVGVSWVSQW